MRATFAGLSMAMRALMTQQTAIDTTNQNISNASTPGYSRQVANITEFTPYTAPAYNSPAGPGEFGTGSIVSGIDRIRDNFVDQQWRAQTQTLGDAQVQQGILQQVQGIFNEPSQTGIQAQLTQFWNAWRDLANSPSSGESRTSLIQNGVGLADTLNQVRKQLVGVQNDLDQQVKLKVVDINNLAQQIASLNDQIVKSQGGGQKPNDLLDQRGVLLDQLAADTNYEYVTNPDGSMFVTISGRPLVIGNQAFGMQAQPNPANQDLSQVVWQSDGQPVNLQGGALKGTIDARDQIVAGQISNLDTLANTLIAQVNGVVEQGYGLPPGNATGPAVDFFSGTSAADIAVTSAVQNDSNLVAAAAAPNSPGDGSNALKVADLESATVLNGNSQTMNDFYNSQITQLGVTAQQSDNLINNETALVQNLTQQREQTSGVSLDEESANLIKFQQSYQAAARVVTTIDEMLNTVIGSMGLVGRG